MSGADCKHHSGRRRQLSPRARKPTRRFITSRSVFTPQSHQPDPSAFLEVRIPRTLNDASTAAEILIIITRYNRYALGNIIGAQPSLRAPSLDSRRKWPHILLQSPDFWQRALDQTTQRGCRPHAGCVGLADNRRDDFY